MEQEYHVLTEEEIAALNAMTEQGIEWSIETPPSPESEYFKAKNYVVLENVISTETANLLYRHVKNNAKRLAVLSEIYGEENVNVPDTTGQFGWWGDTQVPGDFCLYGDPIFDDLLEELLPKFEEAIGEELVPTYSYHRLYTTGSTLGRHTDRKACDYSVTLTLGNDLSNIDKNTYPDYKWAMWVKENGIDTPVPIGVTEAIVYRGMFIEHWREEFHGKNHAQVFLHYNKKHDGENEMYDNRPFLGLGKRTK
jgi:hypothetical protein